MFKMSKLKVAFLRNYKYRKIYTFILLIFVFLILIFSALWIIEYFTFKFNLGVKLPFNTAASDLENIFLGLNLAGVALTLINLVFISATIYVLINDSYNGSKFLRISTWLSIVLIILTFFNISLSPIEISFSVVLENGQRVSDNIPGPKLIYAWLIFVMAIVSAFLALFSRNDFSFLKHDTFLRRKKGKDTASVKNLFLKMQIYRIKKGRYHSKEN